MPIIFHNVIAEGNGGDGFRIGPGAEVVLSNIVTSNNAAGVRMDISATVALSNVKAFGNRESGFVIESFEDFIKAFPELKGVDSEAVKEAASQVARAEPAARESALKQTKLYGILSSGGFVNWASLLVALAQFGFEILKQ